jgi:hypothetical protein
LLKWIEHIWCAWLGIELNLNLVKLLKQSRYQSEQKDKTAADYIPMMEENTFVIE